MLLPKLLQLYTFNALCFTTTTTTTLERKQGKYFPHPPVVQHHVIDSLKTFHRGNPFGICHVSKPCFHYEMTQLTPSQNKGDSSVFSLSSS
jgi:hypothetical protein